MRKWNLLLFSFCVCLGFDAAVSCFGAETKGVEFVLEIHNEYPTPQFPAGMKIVPDGKVVESNGFTSTVEKCYCRQSPSGYLIKTGDNDWSLLFGKQPDLSGENIIARFGGERLFKMPKDAPFQYTQTIDSMTNELKNGFLPAEEEALVKLGMLTGLGIGDSFSIESKEPDKLLLHLKLKTFPDTECLGRLTLSNSLPSTLDIVFTNKFNETMIYHYDYKPSADPRILDFDQVHLVVSNASRGTIRYKRDVQALAFQGGGDFSKRSDFGFPAAFSEKNTWVWVGDQIKGMNEKLDYVAKHADTFIVVPPAKKNLVIFLRIVIICLMIGPPVVWGVITLMKNKQKRK